MVFLTTIMAAYLVGAIPFAYILAKAHGKDVRSIGSGNIGATNLARALGRTWGYVCFILDVLKGLVPMLVTLVDHQAGLPTTRRHGDTVPLAVAGRGVCGGAGTRLSGVPGIQGRQGRGHQLWCGPGSVALLTPVVRPWPSGSGSSWS